MEDLVYALNLIPTIVTIGSCSGHGTHELFVTLNILDYDTMLFLVNIINLNFYNDFRLTTSEILYNKNPSKIIFMEIVSTRIGEEAYKKALEFAKYIRENIGNVYPKLDKDVVDFDGYRIQIYDYQGNILVDDFSIKTWRFSRKEMVNFAHINRMIIVNKCYFSFDMKYYFNVDSKLFKYNFIDLLKNPDMKNFKRIKFDIKKFEKYPIVDINVAEFSDASIAIDTNDDFIRSCK